MLLVVIGHSLTLLVSIDSARGLYLWIYLFHMPFFALISGYTARNYVGSPRQVRRLVSTLVVPYLLVETSLQLITQHYEQKPEHLMLLSPQWLAWFLAAMVIWRLTTPIWRSLKHPILVAVAISLASGLIEIPNFLAVHKALGMLPFYVVGMYFRLEWFWKLGTLANRIASVVLLGTAFVVCQLYPVEITERWRSTWLLWKWRYDEIDAGWIEGLAIRSVMLVIAFTLTFAALSLIPRGHSWTSDLGQRTLYCYLLHGYVIAFLTFELDIWPELKPYGNLAVLGCVAAAIGLANLLMTKPVATVFRPVFEPELNWLFPKHSPDKLPS